MTNDKVIRTVLTPEQVKLGLIANAIYTVWGTRVAKKMGRSRNQRKWPTIVVSDQPRGELYPDSVRDNARNLSFGGYGYGRRNDVDTFVAARGKTALLNADFFFVRSEEYVMVPPTATKGDLLVGWCYFLYTRSEHWRPGPAYRGVHPWRKACEAAMYSVKARYDHIDRASILSGNNEGVRPWDKPAYLAPFLERLALLALSDALTPLENCVVPDRVSGLGAPGDASNASNTTSDESTEL